MGKTIVIRSLNKDKFNGISRHAKTTYTLTTELGPGGYRTGLTKEEEIRFEKELGLKEGTLNKKSIWWSEVEIKIPAKQLKLDLSDPINELKLKVMQASSKFANSQLELNKWPNAQYVIVDEQEEAELESIIIDKEITAYEKFMNTTVEDKRGILKLYGKRGVDNTTESLVKTTLHKELKADPDKFLKIIEDKDLKTKMFIYDLIEYNILTKVKNYYKDGDEVIGGSMEEVIAYLNTPKNNTLKVSLQDKLSKARKKSQITV